jgi:hypothetical protein
VRRAVGRSARRPHRRRRGRPELEPSAPTVEPPPPQEEPRDFCPNCGAAYEPLQEYCLECGERLPVNRGLIGVLASGWQRRIPWYPGDWMWPALGFLGVAIVATVVAVLLGSHRSSGSKTVVATGNSVTLGPGAASGTVPTVATGTLPTAPEPTVSGPTPTAPAPKPKPAPGALAEWPAGKSGYTVVLESVPTSAGRAFAVTRAKRARAAGLGSVGVLDSSNYSSFHPGYFVVFSGIYGSPGDASQAVGTAHARGFRDAYEKQVTR